MSFSANENLLIETMHLPSAKLALASKISLYWMAYPPTIDLTIYILPSQSYPCMCACAPLRTYLNWNNQVVCIPLLHLPCSICHCTLFPILHRSIPPHDLPDGCYHLLVWYHRCYNLHRKTVTDLYILMWITIHTCSDMTPYSSINITSVARTRRWTL